MHVVLVQRTVGYPSTSWASCLLQSVASYNRHGPVLVKLNTLQVKFSRRTEQCVDSISRDTSHVRGIRLISASDADRRRQTMFAVAAASRWPGMTPVRPHPLLSLQPIDKTASPHRLDLWTSELLSEGFIAQPRRASRWPITVQYDVIYSPIYRSHTCPWLASHLNDVHQFVLPIHQLYTACLRQALDVSLSHWLSVCYAGCETFLMSKK